MSRSAYLDFTAAFIKVLLHTNLISIASGDLNDIVKTLACLPVLFRSSLEIVFNDADSIRTARNIIILLVALTVENLDEAIDVMFHLWYSSFITKAHFSILQEQIRPLIQRHCDNIASEVPGKNIRKVFSFKSCSISVTLPKVFWEGLLSLFDLHPTLTTEEASLVRTAAFCLGHIDWEQRTYEELGPNSRVGWKRFQQDGILLPFGASRDAFTIPNP